MNMNSSKDKIIKLENNKEYFVIETLMDNNIDYLLLLNLVDDKEIKIVKKITEDDEDYIVYFNLCFELLGGRNEVY